MQRKVKGRLATTDQLVGSPPRTGALRGQRRAAKRSLPLKKTHAAGRTGIGIVYDPGEGIGKFVNKIRHATPMELIQVERRGVGGRLLKDMAIEMDIPQVRFFSMIGVPKATAEMKASGNAMITGAGGQAALGMVRLLGIAQSIVDNSTADLSDFDVGKWLGQWIERPQPALGGKKPAELLDTPTGVEVVSRVLGAIESGAYL
jgi:putative toxin-antitoxin system antitoxin component (TIGR02293 family)